MNENKDLVGLRERLRDAFVAVAVSVDQDDLAFAG
jgi:hypothetical protein